MFFNFYSLFIILFICCCSAVQIYQKIDHKKKIGIDSFLNKPLTYSWSGSRGARWLLQAINLYSAINQTHSWIQSIAVMFAALNVTLLLAYTKTETVTADSNVEETLAAPSAVLREGFGNESPENMTKSKIILNWCLFLLVITTSSFFLGLSFGLYSFVDPIYIGELAAKKNAAGFVYGFAPTDAVLSNVFVMHPSIRGDVTYTNSGNDLAQCDFTMNSHELAVNCSLIQKSTKFEGRLCGISYLLGFLCAEFSLRVSPPVSSSSSSSSRFIAYSTNNGTIIIWYFWSYCIVSVICSEWYMVRGLSIFSSVRRHSSLIKSHSN